MKLFFRKKQAAAVLFFLAIVLSFVAICIGGKADLQEIAEEWTEIDSAEDMLQWTQNTEATLADAILYRRQGIEAYGGIQKILDKHSYNGFSYIKAKDGNLYYGATAEGSYADLEEYTGNVRRLKEAVEKKGAKLIVVLPPAKLLYGVSDAEAYLPINNPNGRMDKFLTLMMKNDIFAIDMRLPMQASGEEDTALFFKTDHHWTPLAAFYATRELVEKVEEKYGDAWDAEGYYTDLRNYHIETYPQSMLGHSGRDTGILYSGLEDYTLLLPECSMRFTWTDHIKKTTQRGSFREVLLDMDKLTRKNFYQESANEVYLHEALRRDTIRNLSNPDGPKLAVIRDSYFSTMACFLAPMCSEIDMVRNKQSQNGLDYEAFIRESDADYVILEIYPYNLSAGSFDFFREK